MNSSTRHIDYQVVKQLKVGNKSAFETVFEKYKNNIYQFVCKALPQEEDSEGIVQEVFINLWINRAQLDENKSLKSYLFTIAKNQVYDHLRKLYSKRKYLESLYKNYSENISSTENEVEYWEFERYLFENINQLPERRREIYKLSKLEGKSYKEIASLLNISENTVDMQMRKANSAIKEAIQQYLSLLLIYLINN